MIMIYCFITSFQDPFLVGLWNARNLWLSLKLLYFKTQTATFVGITEKLLLFEINCYICGISKNCYFFTESAMFPGKSTSLLLLV